MTQTHGTNGAQTGTPYRPPAKRTAVGAAATLKPLGVAGARMVGTLDPVARDLGWRIQRHYATVDDLECLRALLPDASISRAGVRALLRELTESAHLRAALSTDQAEIWRPDLPDLPVAARPARLLNFDRPGRGRALLLYATARLLRPAAIVETGCFSGWDSAVLLQAIERNGVGHLHTIDLPATPGERDPLLPGGGMAAGLTPGFLVPDALRERWTLTFGDSRRELPALLSRLDEVGLFFHDSDHSYLHMMWEFTTAWPHLGRRGVLVSDDISWNTAFVDFATGCERRPVIHHSNANVGALRA